LTAVIIVVKFQSYDAHADDANLSLACPIDRSPSDGEQSMGLFCNLLSSSEFLPYAFGYLSDRSLTWLYVAADRLIAFSYFLISIRPLYFMRKRRGLLFSWMLLCFGIFIVASRTTRMREFCNLWHAANGVGGVATVVAALSSITTAILQVNLLPRRSLCMTHEI
jgi:hypothetical protein